METPMSTAACNNAFDDLARIFSTRHNRIFEVEILPSGLGPFLQEGGSVGITKKYLTQAFVIARQILLGNLDTIPSSETLNIGNAGENPGDVKLSVSSEIILLFDCEHLTACNWRKRRLLALVQHLERLNSETLITNALDAELSLMTTFLCSPLHRHTKSPTLWQHRLWVMNLRLQFQQVRKMVDIMELFKTELTTILCAGERHPKNYYAFNYIRKLHAILSGPAHGNEKNAVILARSILDSTLSWCLAHPADISGWMFMLYLLENVPEETTRITHGVVWFALDIGWKGESLWIFVAMAVKAFDIGDHIEHILGADSKTALAETCAFMDGPDKCAVPERSWKLWLAKAEAYWAAG